MISLSTPRKLYILPTVDLVHDMLSFMTTLENTSVNYNVVFNIMVDCLSDIEHISHQKEIFYQSMVDVTSKIDSERFAGYMANVFDAFRELFIQCRLWGDSIDSQNKVSLSYHGLHHYNLVIEATYWTLTP